MPTTREKRQQKERSKRQRRRNILLLVMGLLCAYFLYSVISVQVKIHQQKELLTQLDGTIAQQRLENDELARVLTNGGEADYIERIAREKLGYAQVGERVFVDLAGKEEPVDDTPAVQQDQDSAAAGEGDAETDPATDADTTTETE